MSELAINPLGSLPDGAGEDTSRQHVADLVKSDTVSVDAANAALTAKGYAPLRTDSREYYQARFDALQRSDEFQKNLLANDPEAVSAFQAITTKLTQAQGKLLDKTAPPNAPSSPVYDQLRRSIERALPGDNYASVVEAQDAFATLASSLHMDGKNAAAMVEMIDSAGKATAGMTPEAKTNWSETELNGLRSNLGSEPDEILKVANETLHRLTGEKFDVAALTRSHGRNYGLQLVFHAQAAAFRNGW